MTGTIDCHGSADLDVLLASCDAGSPRSSVARRRGDGRVECARWADAARTLNSHRTAAEREVQTHWTRVVHVAGDVHAPLLDQTRLDKQRASDAAAADAKRTRLHSAVAGIRKEFLQPAKPAPHWLDEARRSLTGVDTQITAAKRERARALELLDAEAAELTRDLDALTLQCRVWDEEATAGGGGGGSRRRGSSIPRAGSVPRTAAAAGGRGRSRSVPRANGGGGAAAPAAAPTAKKAAAARRPASAAPVASQPPSVASSPGVGGGAAGASSAPPPPPAVAAYERFLAQSGGRSGGWADDEHQIFLRVVTEDAREAAVVGRVSEATHRSREDVLQHLRWHRLHAEALEAKRSAVAEWQEHRALDRMNEAAAQQKRAVSDEEAAAKRAQARAAVEGARRRQEREALEAWRERKRAVQDAAAQRMLEAASVRGSAEAAEAQRRAEQKRALAERRAAQRAQEEGAERVGRGGGGGRRSASASRAGVPRSASAQPRPEQTEALLHLRARDHEIVQRRREQVKARNVEVLMLSVAPLEMKLGIDYTHNNDKQLHVAALRHRQKESAAQIRKVLVHSSHTHPRTPCIFTERNTP